MDLSQLAEFMSFERKKFETAIRTISKDLDLQGIAKEIELEPFEYLQTGFSEGQRLEFILHQGHYNVSMGPEKLVLSGAYGIPIREFGGEEVRDLYRDFSAKIQKAIDEDDTPF